MRRTPRALTSTRCVGLPTPAVALALAVAVAALGCAGAEVEPQGDGGAVRTEAGVCFSRCTIGARQCAATATPGGSGFQQCVEHANGCPDWGQVQACPANEVCSGGVCRKNCVDQCTLGAKQCSGAGTVECTKNAAGCTDWSPVSVCPAGKVCSGGACVDTCVDQCTAGAKQCSGSGVQTCAKAASGCTDWGNTVPCGGGKVCSGGACVSSCADQCTLGAKQCSGSGVQTCAKAASGCTDWGNAIACTGGQVCSGGQCASTCSNQCTQAATRCAGSGVQTCETMPTGCRDWGNAIACTGGQVCSGGKCVATCTDQCTFGVARCASGSAAGVQSCVRLPSGCTDWGSTTPCKTGESCSGGSCQGGGGCTKGARRCSGATLEECDGSGWLTVQVCPQACVNNACSQTVQCTPGTRRCGSGSVEECNPSGTAWLYVRSCALGCSGGLCTGGCTAGARRCNGSTAEVCKSDGSGYITDKSCATTFCTKGTCAKTSLLLDNTVVTMEGEHVYAGDVILKNNSQINVGPSGWLRIRAKNIDIDATSSITAPPEGDAATGRAGGGTKSCKHSYCSSSTSSTAVGHGGYGTAGSGESKRLYNCYRYSASRYCNISGTGGKAFGGYVADISMGGSGGGCSTPNGGGMIDLLAQNKLTMAGTLRADGGTPAQGGGGSCGYGSGGGVRLVAEDLDVTGVLSAKGSGGAGDGRIKLLYGSQKNVNATTSGVVEQSLLPPLDVRSSTHPDPSKVYNDGFSFLNLAWSKPFSNLAGYFYKLANALPTSQSHVPNAQSTWLATESLSVDATSTVVGGNVFAVVGVAPNAALGLVQSAFSVTINDKPPTVSSSSHPSSSSWYGSGTVILGWSDVVPAGNTRAYYYVFDQFADTVPTKGDSKLPSSDKALLVAGQPAGAIRFLHLIAEDSAGYLTNKAAHFRVQVGPEPGKGGISGAIREAGSTPPKLLDGVEVTLNRGVLSTTSATGGQYFFSSTVWAGTWELRARKAGYQDFVKTLSVSAGQNTSLDIQLTKKP